MRKSKIVVSVFLALSMVVFMATPALANGSIQPLSAGSCKALFTNSGKTVTFGLNGYGTSVESTISGTAYLQELRNGKWVTVSTATGSAKNTSSIKVSKTYTVAGGYSYRVTASCTAGGVTKSDTSATKDL